MDDGGADAGGGGGGANGGQDLITPEQLAAAVFGDEEFVARSTTFDHQIQEVAEKLAPYSMNICKMSIKNTEEDGGCKEHAPFVNNPACVRKPKVQKLYCARCTTSILPQLRANNNVLKCSVVAEVETSVDVAMGVKSLKVVKLYPHPKECLVTDEEEKHKWIMAQCNGGKGWSILQFDNAAIVGSGFNDIIGKINGLTKTKLSDKDTEFGKRICNDLDAPPDLRFYFKTNDPEQTLINEYYDLSTPSRQTVRDNFHIRLMLFLANNFDIASELPFQFPQHPQNGGHPPYAPLPALSPHLFLSYTSFIFGGYMPENCNETVGQIPHMDIGEQVNTADGTTYTVSQNPSLRNKFKPGSIIIPVGEKRSIFICNEVGDKQDHKTEVHVKQGEIIVFEGDLVHGGMSYISPPDSTLELYPSIHTLIASSLHNRDLDVFDISAIHCLSDPEFKCYVPTLERVHVLKEVTKQFKSMTDFVDTVQTSGSEEAKQGIEEHLDTCIEELMKMKTRDVKKRKKRKKTSKTSTK